MTYIVALHIHVFVIVTVCSACRQQKSNIQSRELGVMFENLRVVGLGTTENYQPTFGSLFDPRVMMESFREARKPPLRHILKGFEGVLRPGEMLREFLIPAL